MPSLRVVTVTLEGPGEQMGVITFDGATLSGDTRHAAGIVATLQRRFPNLSPADMFGRLETEGWSNGQLMIEP